MKEKKAPIKPKKLAAKKPAEALKPAARKKVSRKPAVADQTTGYFGVHSIRLPKGSHKKRKYLGRGSSSGHGKTSTRGSKGQTSRAGRDFYAGFEGGQTPLIRRIPKRGFTSKFKKVYQIVNLSDLARIKETAINLELLEQKNIIKDKNRLVKILGDGEVKSAISVQAHAISKQAQDKITAVGGKVELIHV